MDKLKQIFKIKELRNKVFAVIGMMIVFRFLASIPVPGVDISRIKDFFSGNQFASMLNTFSGSGMSNFSIVMLGVGPYISASIIMQLMTMIVPQVKKWYREEGEAGRQKFNQITRLITIPISFLQGSAMIAILKKSQVLGELTMPQTLTILLTVTAGTIFLMWLGELISEKGIGNGVSLLIFAGIVSGFPAAVRQLYNIWTEDMLLTYVGFGAAIIAVIYAVVFVTEGQRNIPVNYARRVRGMKSSGGGSAYLPLRVNQAGVIPIIFAMALMSIPQMLTGYLATLENESLREIGININVFIGNQLYYGLIYFVLVVAFTFFYTKVSFEPKNIAENLQKNGGYIPGIRPGKKTETYLDHLVNRITLIGALFLGAIAVLPFVMQELTGIQALSVGGTSLLIVVSVVIETIKQIEGQLVMRSYEEID